MPIIFPINQTPEPERQFFPALGTVTIVSPEEGAALGSVIVSQFAETAFLGTVTVGGGAEETAALSIAVIVERKGIYFLVETIDGILSGAKGDC